MVLCPILPYAFRSALTLTDPHLILPCHFHPSLWNILKEILEIIKFYPYIIHYMSLIGKRRSLKTQP